MPDNQAFAISFGAPDRAQTIYVQLPENQWIKKSVCLKRQIFWQIFNEHLVVIVGAKVSVFFGNLQK